MNEQLPPAGWYPDPSQAQTQRYWTGSEWTEQRAPAAPAKKADGNMAVGVVIALLIPIVGFIWGMVMLVSGRGNGGWVVLSSFVGAFLWFMLIAGLATAGA